MLFHEALARALADHGVTHVFGVVGDANLFVMDSFQRETGGTYVSVANEAGAVLAANGFAETSGRVGVATVTHGPAFTNTVTALVEGLKNRTPLLLVAGDTATTARDHHQKVAQRELALVAGVGFEQVRSPATMPEDVATAIRRAELERRPIVLNVPAEFQWAETDASPVPARSVVRQPAHPDDAALDAAVGMIAGSRRPIVLAGRGVADADGRKALLRLAERIGAPVATTLRAKDLFRGHPHDLGVFGTLANPVAQEVIARSDCVVVFGAGLNHRTTVDGSLLDGKRVVQVDSDRGAVNRFSRVGAPVIADAAVTADRIVEWLDAAGVPGTGFASPELAERIAAYDYADFVDESTEVTVDPRSFLKALEETFPAERTMVIDAGRCIFNVWAMLHVPEPSAYVHTVNFGSIGLGMGNAVGASFGADRPVLLLTGDGGFMLGGLTEFNTAVRHGSDLVVVLFNDSAYGAEHIQFRHRDMDPAISTFDWPDFAPVAQALGGDGYTVRCLADVEGAMEMIRNRTRPLLIDVRIDPENVQTPGR